MPNIPAVAAYEAGAREFSNSDFFTNQNSSNLGIAFNAFKTQFTEGNPGYFDEEDLKRIDSINESLLTEYKNKANIPRFIPKAEEWETYYEPIPDFSTAKDADEATKMATDWEAASYKKSADLRPADADDFKTHLSYMTDNFIRQSAFDAKKSKGGVMAWMDDKTNRTIEGGLSMVSPFIPDMDRWLAENLPEDPSTADDFSSQLFAGVGQLVSQAAVALGTSAVAGPEAGVAAIGTIYSARAVVEGYKEEMKKSGNPDKALNVGLAGIPGAAFETFADSMLFGMGKSGKAYLQAFKNATTREAKEAILKEAFPKMGKEALKNGLQEATLGSVVADWTTGYGRYLASGDDSYIPTAEQLGKGALVEGILGAGYSSLNSMAFDGVRTEAFAKELADKNKAKANDIYKALAGKNYQQAVEIAARDYPDTAPAPAATPAATPAAPGATTPNTPVSPNASGITIPQPSDAGKNISLSVIGSTNLAYLEQQKKTAQTSGDVASVKRIEESLQAIRGGTFVNPEFFTVNPEPLVANGFEESIDPIGIEDSYDVTLDNNQKIQSDDRHIFVKGLTNRDVTTQNIAKGGVGIIINEGQASLVLGNNFKTSGKLQFSQTPRKGFAAVKIKDAFANEQGQTVVTAFQILGQVQESSRSEKSKQKTQAVVEKFKPKEGQTVENQDGSGLTEAAAIIQSVEQNESFSEGGLNSIEQAIDTTINMLDEYAGKNTSMKSDIEELQNELLLALDVAKYKTKPIEPVKPVRGDVDLFRKRIAKQESEQLELGIPTKLSDLSGKQVTFQGQTGPLSVDGGLAYVGDIEIAGSEALIEDIEGLETDSIPSKPQRPEVVDGIKQKRQKRKISTREKNRLRRENKAEQRRKQFLPTPSNITSEPEAIFESVTDEGVVVETVVVPATEPVVLNDEAKLLKEIERTKKLIADDPQDKEGWSVTLKEQEAQLALVRAKGATNVTTAVQQANEEKAQDDKDKKEAATEPASKNTTEEDVTSEDVSDDIADQLNSVQFSMRQISGENAGLSTKKILITPNGEVIPISDETGHPKYVKENLRKYLTNGKPDVKRMVKDGWYWGSVSKDSDGNYKFIDGATKGWGGSSKLGIQKGQVAVFDVEVTNPRKDDENGYHIFSAGGKSYAVKYFSGFGNGGKKGWHLFNLEAKETILIGNNKEEARTSLAKLINDKSPDVSNFIVQDKSNSELLKEVVYSPPKVETVEERIEKLNQKAKDEANKVISDKVDEHISKIEQPVRKANWENNRQNVIDYINDIISGVDNAIDTFLGKLKASGIKLTQSFVNDSDDIASSLDAKVKPQIAKDRNETVVDEVDESDTTKEESASKEDILESVEEVVETLSKEDSEEIASELNVPNNPTSVSDALSTAYSDWLVNAKEFSDKVIAILKRVSISLKNKITAIAIAISVLPTILNSSSVVDTKIYDLNEVKSFGTAFREEQKKKLSVDFGGLDSLEINVPKSSNSKMSVPANINISFEKETDFGSVSYSDNVKDASDWILNSSNNEGKPYLVADKVNGLIYVFDRNGKLKKRTYAIFGKDQGDVIQEGKSVTPAGVFKATIDNTVDDPAYGGNTVDFFDKGDTVLAIHRVWLGRPEEGRLDRIKSKDPTDNRISLGCINVTDQIYDNIIYPEFNSANGGMVYILPETKQGNKIVERQKLANAKIKYSIGSEQSGATIDQKEAQDYIAENHPGIEIVNTRKTTEDGHQWRGRTDFTSGTPRIAINLSNIRDLAQLRNVIHEELAHIAYNDPSISTSLKKIVESTKLQEELGKIYESGEVFEESVVKRMADLVDSYTEKGMFDKLFTAIKSYIKDKLGMTLNDNDLSYIAYRAIVRAGKVTSGSGQTKFGKGENLNLPENYPHGDNIPKNYTTKNAKKSTQLVIKKALDLIGKERFKQEVNKRVAWVRENQPIVDTSESGQATIIEGIARDIVEYAEVNKNIKFNKVESSSNQLFEPDDDILSVVNGKISEEKKRTLKNLKRAIRKKLEKELIIDEPQAWNALKAVNYRYLDGEQLKAFNGLLSQFVRTRSKSKDPGAGVRTPTDTVIAQATELAKAANQGHFNALQLQHDFLEGKDFQNYFQGDIDKVNQLAKDERGMKDSDTPSDKDADSLQTWQLRMFELQEEAWENRDYLQDRLDEQFPSASNITKNDIIAKRAGIYTETVDDVMAGHKEVAKQYINSLMSDPTNKTWRELRRQYYGLQDFLADGYLNVEDFVSGDIAALLQGGISEESFVKMYNAPWRSKMHEGASSFYANTRTMGTEVAELAHKLTTKFRAGILAAERLMADFIDPTLNEFMEKAVALNGGKPFDGQQLNLAGIYGRARQFKATESVTEGILKSKAAIEESLKKDTNSIRTGRKEAALIHSKFTSDLYAGIDANTPNEEALGILEANAERLLPAGLIGYVKDVVDLFEVTKPLSRFTSEFGLGRPFDEVINYIPALAINKDGTPIKMDLVDITNTSDDMGLGHINQDTNMQQSGGSSTKIRKGFLPEGMVYAWNINHLAHNRMRLNLNDYLTLPQRRELNNIISGKGTKRGELAKLLKDDGQQERVSHIQRTVLTMWQNTVQASNYVSEGQGLMNTLSNMWASTKLASLYQLPGQIASNTIPYFIVHAGSPKRIKYLFDAMSIILKRRAGMPLDPRLEKTVDRVLSVIESRSQEQFLDKSIALDRTSNQTLEKLKSSKIWNSIKGINKLRETVLFAPFKFSDYISGAPMMLANIMHHEEVAGRATGWEGLTYNDDSFIRSLDETERFIGIGAASRRGVWTNNKNGWMSITRNIISAFSSHRVNNATNFAVEYARLRDENLSSEEKLKSLRYIAGMAAQSAAFSAVKWGMIATFYNILTAAMGEEENEDELEKEYRKLLTGNHKPGDKKILEAEIAMREKIRNEFIRAKENNTRTDIVLIRGLQDVVANTFLIPAVSDMPLNMVIHAVYDQYEADRFKEVKEAAVTDLEAKLKKAKASKNTKLAIELQKELSRWNAQEAIPLVYEQRGVTPMGGLYGGVVNEASKFMEAAAGSLIKAEAISLQDAFLGAGLIGLSQPDINRWARMYSKIEEHEADFAEKLQEIKEKEIKKSRDR